MARRRRRARAIVGAIVVLALAVGAVTVFTLAYHQARSNDRAEQAAAAQRRAAAGVQVVGAVISVGANGVIVRMPNGAARRLVLEPTTAVQDATTGAAADVKVGKRAIVDFRPGFLNVAREVVVVPGAAPLGQSVARVGFGYLWLQPKAGPLSPPINIARASIYNAVRATRADIKPGLVIVAHARTTTSQPIRFIASEIVLLPAGSHFG